MKTISITFAASTLFLFILFFTLQAYAGNNLPRATVYSSNPDSAISDTALIESELSVY